jgi:hypothetical protein
LFQCSLLGILDWYYANLEYACATNLKSLSLTHWDQDDLHAIAGNHHLIPEGYASLIGPLASGLNILTSKVVARVKYDGEGVEVYTREGEVCSVLSVLVRLSFVRYFLVSVCFLKLLCVAFFNAFSFLLACFSVLCTFVAVPSFLTCRYFGAVRASSQSLWAS